jgi:DNA-binding response OmpR family regulator
VLVLIATDADFVVDDVTAALSNPDTSFVVCRNGRDVARVVKARTPDICILDMQSGSMGAMAVTMSLRLDESSGLLPNTKVLMLLDRRADLHLAKRSAADGWVIKPLDPITLQLAVDRILNPPAEVSAEVDAGDNAEAESAEEDTVAAG